MLSVKPWRAEAIIRLILNLMLCFCAGYVAVAIMHRGTADTRLSIAQMMVAALSFQGAVLVFVTHFLREHGTTWKEAFGFATEWRRALLLGFIGASLFLPIGWGLQWVSAEAMLHVPKLHLKPEEQSAVQTLALWGTAILFGAIHFNLATFLPLAALALLLTLLYEHVDNLLAPVAAHALFNAANFAMLYSLQDKLLHSP